MTKIGRNLGDALLAEIDNNESSVYLACTVEDADFLARGILNRLENRELFYIEINLREAIAHSPQRAFK